RTDENLGAGPRPEDGGEPLRLSAEALLDDLTSLDLAFPLVLTFWTRRRRQCDRRPASALHRSDREAACGEELAPGVTGSPHRASGSSSSQRCCRPESDRQD